MLGCPQRTIRDSPRIRSVPGGSGGSARAPPLPVRAVLHGHGAHRAAGGSQGRRSAVLDPAAREGPQHRPTLPAADAGAALQHPAAVLAANLPRNRKRNLSPSQAQGRADDSSRIRNAGRGFGFVDAARGRTQPTGRSQRRRRLARPVGQRLRPRCRSRGRPRRHLRQPGSCACCPSESSCASESCGARAATCGSPAPLSASASGHRKRSGGAPSSATCA